MRILVDARRPLRPRLARAAAGLAARGHEVTWLGAAPEPLVPGTTRAAGSADLARGQVDVVLADGRAPFGAAVGAWLARARALLVALSLDDLQRWNVLDRWAWDGTHGFGLIESGEAGAAQAGVRGIDLARIALWSDDGVPEESDPGHPDTEILERGCERALARRRARAFRPAAFLDRDGTLVVERGYLADPSDLELLPGVAGALRQLAASGYALVVVSNQSGVGRGFFPLASVHAAMARLRRMLAREGVELDAIYFCPHRPEAGCACRKPGTELLERAADDLHLDLAQSVMLGDKLLDVETGHRAGARGVLLRTGYGREEERRLPEARDAERPDAIRDDLAAAAAWLLEPRDEGAAGGQRAGTRSSE